VGNEEPTITLCMIVRDEAETLRAAVESAKGLASELIIGVDKRSEDGTLIEAEHAAAQWAGHSEVYLIEEWKGFSHARNFAASCAHSEWVLILDGHERLAEVDQLKEEFASARSYHGDDLVNVDLRVVVRPEEKGTRQPTMAWQPRIYQQGLLYEGIVHNKLQLPEEGHSACLMGGYVIHERPAGTSIRRAGQRSADVPEECRRRLEANPEDHEAIYYLAYHAMDDGDDDKAVELAERYLEATKGKVGINVMVSRCVCMQNASCVHLRNKRDAEAEAIASQAIGEWPMNAMALCLMAEICLLKAQQSDGKQAHWVTRSEWYAQAAATAQMPVCGIFVPSSAWTYLPQIILARAKGARQAYEEALGHTSTAREYWDIMPSETQTLLANLEFTLRAFRASEVLIPEHREPSVDLTRQRFGAALQILTGDEDNGSENDCALA